MSGDWIKRVKFPPSDHEHVFENWIPVSADDAADYGWPPVRCMAGVCSLCRCWLILPAPTKRRPKDLDGKIKTKITKGGEEIAKEDRRSQGQATRGRRSNRAR